MSNLYLRLQNGIAPPLRVAEPREALRFHQSPAYAGIEIDLELSRAGDAIESKRDAVVSAELAEALSKITESVKLSNKQQRELRSFVAPLREANRRLFRLILQELRERERHILTHGPTRWSLDGITWKELPFEIFFTAEELYAVYDVDGEWRDHIQSVLNLHEEPLGAIEYLREARLNRDERFAWIGATIAAELAVKEALIRLEPKLETLLLEVPSPPLHKLYGSVLKAVAGKESPYASGLRNGAEKRNKLIHRSKSIELDSQEVVDYVAMVEQAIWHLIALCRRVASGGKQLNLHRAYKLMVAVADENR